MFRKPFASLVLVVPFVLALTVTAAFAQSRGRATGPLPLSGSTVSGIVTSVDGNVVSLAMNVVKIDISRAKVIGSITVGSLIFATLSSSNVGMNATLPAATVGVVNIPDVTLTGPVQAIDTVHGDLTVLGQEIDVDANTSFGGDHDVRGLADIAVGDTVEVEARAFFTLAPVPPELIANRILVIAPVIPVSVLLHGTVKSIGTDSWVITNSQGTDITVVINPQTKIIGSPKVGDTVDVLANVDSANNYVAISIIGEIPLPQMHLSGVVKSIGATQWVIGPAVGLGPDFLVQVNAQTKIVGNPQVGDHVDVVVQPGTIFVAISITKT